MDFKEINHLLKLARIELSSQEKEKIALDLENILDSDKIDEQKQNISKKLKESAPSLKNHSFKIPPIF